MHAPAQSPPQNAMLLDEFYVMSQAIGIAGPMIRGDILNYLMTGIFLFIVHDRTVMAVFASESAAGELRMIPAFGAAVGALYLQVLTAAILFLTYHVFWEPDRSAAGQHRYRFPGPALAGQHRHRICPAGHQAGLAPSGGGALTSLDACADPHLGVQVRRKCDPAALAGLYRLEPAVPPHRPGARCGLRQ